ncbi:MAG TPA: saccharopine dehydrogenase NADP-binding domain-containing protein [Thermoanaerobaculia bacterium]|nr:saccharopine dehydrogenase NADP-binding domain-containing protein [Thermoanaerobaculia bacterium]
MSRILVIGGRGFFGAAAVELLRRDGERPLVGSRRPGADCRVDAEDPASLRAALRAGDVVIDAAGPFQQRSPLLVETALAAGCDVIDLADSLDYALAMQRLTPRIDRAGTRVLTSCSSVSAVTAALVRILAVTAPTRISAFLAPATRNTSTAATAQSLLASLERPIRVLRGGRLVERRAFSEASRFEFAPPVGTVEARLGESPDAVTLPPIWPTLRDVDLWVDTRRRLLNALFAAAARHPTVRSLLRGMQPAGRRIAKWFGARSGGFAVEVEDAGGARHAAGFVHPRHSYVVAVAPAVLAARAIKARTFTASGLVAADRQVDPQELVDYLERAGVRHFSRI